MAYKRKTWSRKLDEARAKNPAPHRWHCQKTGLEMSIPGVPELEAIIGCVPAGRLITTRQVGDHLTARHRVDRCCPLTVGIFMWLIAQGADEAARDTNREALPWWRVLKTGGELSRRFPGGGDLQRQLLEAEGHRIVARGKRLFAADYEAALADLD